MNADRVLLVWRHRLATGSWGWDIPTGWSDDDEDPVDAIRREIQEESGCRVATVEPLITYHPMSGISSQRYRLYVATGAEQVGEPDKAEAARVEWVLVDDVLKLIAAGRVPDGPSLTGLACYLAMTR